MKQRSNVFPSYVVRQSGAYAVEFALVFVVFFVLSYAIITYAFIFTAQHILNVAADDASRVALRWRTGENIGVRQLDDIRQVVETRAGWLMLAKGGQLDVHVCVGRQLRSGRGVAGQASPECAQYFPASGIDEDSIGVLVLYPYRDAPFIPLLGPSAIVSLAVPEWLAGSSIVTLYRVGMGESG